MITCKNCGHHFEGEFCPNCGQKVNTGRIILRESLHDVLSNYFDFNAPLFRTIKDLFIRPGALIRDYIFGKRKSFSNPVRYFLLMLAIYLIVNQLVGFDPIETFGNMVGATEQPNPDSIGTRASNYLRDHINAFLFLFIFTLGFSAKLFNLRNMYTVPEYLVMAFFAVGHYMFMNSFVILLTLISPSFFLLNYLLVILYPVFVLVQFLQKRPILNTFKSFFTVLFAWIFYALGGWFLSYQIIRIFYT